MNKQVFQQAVTLNTRIEETTTFLNNAKLHQEAGKKLEGIVFVFADTEKNEEQLVLQEWPEMTEEIFQSTIAYVQKVNADLVTEFQELDNTKFDTRK